MSRLKQLLSSTAAKVLTGTAIAAALVLSALEMSPSYTRTEWSIDTAKHRDDTKWETFYIAAPTGTSIPQAYKDEETSAVLGACNEGQCCLDDFCYNYHGSPIVNGYRLFEVTAPTYFANGWRLWANATEEAYWWWSFAQVVDACRATALFTDAQCLALLEGDSRCWLLSTGGCCRYGSRGCEPTSSDLNGTACPYALVTGPMPCVTKRGAGGARRDAERTWTAEELD